MSMTTLDEVGWLRLASFLPQATLDALDTEHALDATVAGSRQLLDRSWCAALVAPIRARLRRFRVLDGDAVAVQCTYFQKTAECNWKVPYHQDLSIPVAARVDHPALSGWSVKEDGVYVQPEETLLQRLLAVRLHLDPCDAETGALRVISGSHRLGRIEAKRVAAMAKRSSEALCLADVGDLVLMRPLLLHASSKAKAPSGRRVLHFVFAPPQPGNGLSWRIAV
jgi:hypothetical protein